MSGTHSPVTGVYPAFTGAGRGAYGDSVPDDLEHRLGLAEDISVQESEDPNPSRLEPSIARSIVLPLLWLRVSTAV